MPLNEPLKRYVPDKATRQSIAVSTETHQALQEIADDLNTTIGKTVEALVQFYNDETQPD